MEVTVVETGDLPAGTVISFHTGSIRRHAPVEKDKAINLSYGSSKEPIRVDLMSQVGSHTFDVVPGQDIYDVPIPSSEPGGREVKLKFQIRDAAAAGAADVQSRSKLGGNTGAAGVNNARAPSKGTGENSDFEPCSPLSPSQKLNTALMMKSYLESHDVLTQMQALLQDMVTNRPEDPVEYMIQRLEEVCEDGQAIMLASQAGSVPNSPQPPKAEPATQKAEPAPGGDSFAGSDAEDSDDDEDDVEDTGIEQLQAQQASRARKGSVSAEAYGAFNQRQTYQPKIIEKDAGQKARLKEVLRQCWMFKAHDSDSLNIIIDAMDEKIVPPDLRLINEGDMGDVMWVVEEGIIDCYKNIKGEDKLVKTCERGDVFGELALLYNCPRAASVQSRDRCVLWQLDQATFKAICMEMAQKQGEQDYEGFTAPPKGESSSSSAKPAEASETPGAAASEQDPATSGQRKGSTSETRCSLSDSHAHDEKLLADNRRASLSVAGDEDNHSDSGEEGEEPPEHCRSSVPVGRKRREGVSAEAMQSQEQGDWKPPKHAKSDAERASLSEMIRTSPDSKLHMLFGNVANDTFEQIIDAMLLKKMDKGGDVIKQGDVGDFFYIVKSGHFDILVSKGGSPPKKVFEAGAGFSFGELALLYNAPRSATITATIESEVWCLDRAAFQNLVVRSAKQKFEQNVEFLSNCDIFTVLDPSERASLAEVLEEEEFDEDEAILEQGEKDDKMFILREGTAVACIKGDQGEVEVKQYSRGDYFGEIALLLGEPRKASVYAVRKCTCLYITRETFMRILGPLQSLMKRNLDKYEKYQDAIKSAEEEEEQADEQADSPARKSLVGDGEAPSEDAFDGAQAPSEDAFDGAQSKKTEKKCRKRERKAERTLANMKAHVVSKETEGEVKSEGEPMTFKEKIALDFENSELVTPTKEFEIAGSAMQAYGGLRLGEKFTVDKTLIVRTEGKKTTDGLEDVYCWNSPTKLKGSTSLSVLCNKGQKSAADPTPNQDNYCVVHVGGVAIYGIFDGHGPFGHLISFRLSQSVPHIITKNENYGKDFEKCLKESFVEAQADLLEFCKKHSINVEASGAAGSVLVFEEQTVHVAFIGDARIMLGSWNRRDSRLIHATEDHKPQLPEERARLEKAGSEVREVDPDCFRIYLPGSSFPGLTMSRAFGDTACAGVMQEPEYRSFLIQPTDEWYAIVASDGIWEFLEAEACMTMTAKKLRLKGPRETVRFLVDNCRKRWAHCCEDYCDDITAVLVQWNVHEKNSAGTNHSMSFKRHE